MTIEPKLNGENVLLDNVNDEMFALKAMGGWICK